MSTSTGSISQPTAVTPTTSTTSTPRTSRFTEGSPLTGSEVLAQPSSNTFLLTILFEMDEHERRRQRSHRDSASSTESFLSSASSSSPTRENRRSTFANQSVELVRRSLEDGNRDATEKARGFKGRLRAWTGGRERSGSVKAYTGT